MRVLSTLLVSICLVSFVALPVSSETSDGYNPSEETVCSPLKEEVFTKGLYGLCVAYCEAQDFINPEIVTSPDQEEISLTAPARQILDAYNKKKQDNDPAMPCILPPEPCPCFTQEELQSIDGYLEGYGSTEFTAFYYDNNVSVREYINNPETAPSSDSQMVWLTAHLMFEPPLYQCLYQTEQTAPKQIRYLRTDSGTLSPQEYSACYQLFLDTIPWGFNPNW